MTVVLKFAIGGAMCHNGEMAHQLCHERPMPRTTASNYVPILSSNTLLQPIATTDSPNSCHTVGMPHQLCHERLMPQETHATRDSCNNGAKSDANAEFMNQIFSRNDNLQMQSSWTRYLAEMTCSTWRDRFAITASPIREQFMQCHDRPMPL